MRTTPALLVLAASWLAACQNPRPRLTALIPSQGCPGWQGTFTIVGDNFIPATILNPETGELTTSLEGFQTSLGTDQDWWPLTGTSWLSVTQVSALPPGSGPMLFAEGALLDLKLIDPRGQAATLGGAYQQLTYADCAASTSAANLDAGSTAEGGSPFDAGYLPEGGRPGSIP
ncbi:MAG: hypothetical protein ABSB49_08465 [Polyangia bacterium]|jgi:hypothetical protein